MTASADIAANAGELETRIREVEERERRLRLALLASDDEIWEYAVAEDRIAFEHEITGTPVPSSHTGSAASPSPAQATPQASTPVRGSMSLADFIATIHPDHRDALRRALDALSQARSEFEEVTIRRRHRGGGWVWVHLRGRIASLDERGRPAMIVGSARDITRMQHNADRLRVALKAAGEELWEFDIARNRTWRENPLERERDDDYDRDPATEVFNRICHPDDLAAIHKIYVDVRWGKAREFHAVYRSRGPGGAWRWMDAHGCGVDPDDQGLPTRIIGTNRDITELKQGEERLRTVLWGSGAELWDVDFVAGTIHRSHMVPDLKVNALGETIRFADLAAAVPPEQAAAIRDGMVAQVKGLSEKFEVWFRLETDEGGWRWMYSHGKVNERAADGRALRMAGTMNDVSAMKAIEDELRVLNEQLEHRVAERTAELTLANVELSQTIARLDETRAQLVESEKMASLGSLVAGVSHEINTPLGVGITGASHLLEELDALERELAAGRIDARLLGERAALMRECGDLVQRSLLRTDKLVRSFKQVAVKQSPEPPRHLVLAELIDGSLLPFASQLAQGGHAIAIDCPATIELETYPGAIQQVLIALLANSLEHAAIPGKPLAIAIRAIDAGADVTIDYRDDGAGMSRDTRLRIFDPFFTTRRGHGSLGLGMHIVYNLVTQRLAGRIRCESEPGTGTSFAIRIPKRAPEAESASA
ncbi:MAG TPA: PAS domain-containing protein [Xanthomonadaceae bacterium]